MTESTQLQTAENNNAGVVKMEPLPPAATTASTANTNLATSPAPSSVMEQQTQQQQTAAIISATLQQQQLQQQQQQQQQYALKWNDYQTSMLSSFRHLRDEEDFVDVTLACDERSFTAHKVVLSACSPYFRKLLKANPCEHPIVILRDVPADDVENLLSFMYNGEVNVGHEHLPEFLKTAHLLQIRGLADVNNGSSASFTPTLASSTPSNKLNNTALNSQLSGSTNKLNFLTAATQALSNSSNSPFTTPSLGSTTPLNNLLNNSSSNLNNNSSNNNNNSNSNNNNSSSNNNNNNKNNNSNSGNTPAIQELKASSASPANHWDLSDSDSNRNNHLTPPPQKRIKSADLFRAQHGISPERLLIDREFPVAGQHPLTRNRDRSRETSRDRDREMRESLLGQALENTNGLQKQHPDMASLHAQSAGEDSNSSDTEPSDRGDAQHDGTMDSMDNQRSHSFPNAFLGLQGIPGLLPGPSGMAANDFVTRRSLEMRVRATDPRPCPKCGKIYRSAHTLRTHLEDKHTVCPGYRCVLCGTVAKSRNSLHSHMSRQHRGISTKDLPVLPMPSAFDPELASRLLAKAGVKISAAELRARASPTNSTGANGQKLDINMGVGMKDEMDDSDDDPEDLTTGAGFGGSTNSNDLSRYHESLLSNFGHANTTISRIRNEAAAAAAAAALGQQKDLAGGQIPTSNAAGQSLLDTYLQFITENTFGMGMSQEHAAAAALHAAKMAQLNAMGHSLDKIPPGLIPPQFDLSKLAGTAAGTAFSTAAANNSGLTIEPIMRREQASTPNNENTTSTNNNTPATHNNDLRRDPSEPMDLGLDGNNQSGSHHEQQGSDNEDNYSEDEGVHNT
ncbi:protein abrupt-like isoform X2 [Lucilia sericata]|uniref:protein abrupt-like isoform X2 n=1 Tax=Lucilia sericata TaxID=13632 RepID=UPI0018A86D09|nr:protein abrupt-like isoform X2 [Lucilia sericata]